MLHIGLWQSCQHGISGTKSLPENKRCMDVSRSWGLTARRTTGMPWRYEIIYTQVPTDRHSVSQSVSWAVKRFRERPAGVTGSPNGPCLRTSRQGSWDLMPWIRIQKVGGEKVNIAVLHQFYLRLPVSVSVSRLRQFRPFREIKLRDLHFF